MRFCWWWRVVVFVSDGLCVVVIGHDLVEFLVDVEYAFGFLAFVFHPVKSLYVLLVVWSVI